MLGPDDVCDVKSDAQFELGYWWIDIRLRIVGLSVLLVVVALLFQVVLNRDVHDMLRVLAAVVGILTASGTLGYVWRWVVPPTWKGRT